VKLPTNFNSWVVNKFLVPYYLKDISSATCSLTRGGYDRNRGWMLLLL